MEFRIGHLVFVGHEIRLSSGAFHGTANPTIGVTVTTALENDVTSNEKFAITSSGSFANRFIASSIHDSLHFPIAFK